MTYLMPVMILFFAMNVASGIGLYWVVSNAFQVFQTMLIANPWKIIAARESKIQSVKDKAKARERALKKAKVKAKKKNNRRFIEKVPRFLELF